MPVLLGGTEVADVRVGAAQASKVYVGTEQVWPSASPPSGGYLDALATLGADVIVDGATETVAGVPLNGTGLTTAAGPDGLTALTGGTGISVPLPALGQPAVVTFAILVKPLSSVYVSAHEAEPLSAGVDRGLELRYDTGGGTEDYRWDQRQNVNTGPLNGGAGTSGWTFLVGRADSANGTTLSVLHNQAARSDNTDPTPSPTLYSWASFPTQSMPGVAATDLHVAGFAIWHDVLLTDQQIDDLYATLTV